jgi:two-component system phosphate regulon sensor histidine kinase PhoR
MLTPFLAIICSILAIVIAVMAVRFNRLHRLSAEERLILEEDHRRSIGMKEHQNRELLNALNDPFLLLDAEGIIRYANSPAEQLFPGRAILDQHLDKVFLDGKLAAPIREAVISKKEIAKQVILSEQSGTGAHHEPAGESVWFVDAGPIEADNPATPVRVIIRNTTAEHHAEQVRKDFVANASHELRTPLAIINGYLENLIEGNLLDDRDTALRFLKIMEKHGRRIARIVEDMLIISRLESGEVNTLRVKPFPVESCVQDVVERLESVIAGQGASVSISSDDPGLRLQGDRFYWTQILFNLVENALKQNPEIPLSVEIGWRKTKDDLVIWVSDNGIGIPAADLPFIFRRFYRVEKHHSQAEIKGTGLGLSIVRRAVEAHNGNIEVTSTPGEITRFAISLPAEAIHQATDHPEAPVSQGDNKGIYPDD